MDCLIEKQDIASLGMVVHNVLNNFAYTVCQKVSFFTFHEMILNYIF